MNIKEGYRDASDVLQVAAGIFLAHHGTMELSQVIWLAVIQGITEFLPISSSAHLIFLPQLMGWADQGVVFDLAVHLGTLIAVMVYFRRDVAQLATGGLHLAALRWHTAPAQQAMRLAVATVPLILVAALLKDIINTNLRAVQVIAISSIGFGLLLWWTDRDKPHCKKQNDAATMPWRDVLVFGVFQALALVPGTSRSGICMTAGRFLGYSRTFSSRFSMHMAIPVILLLAVASMLDVQTAPLNWQTAMPTLLTATFIAALTAFAAIHMLMRLVERIGFLPFVVYRVFLGAGLLWWAAI